MSIRIKLILTYVILLIVSASILIFSGIAIITNIVAKTTEAIIEESDLHVVVTDVIDLLAELKQAEDYEPEKLISPEYIKEINENKLVRNGGIIVRFNREIYNFSNLPKSDEFYTGLIKTEELKKRNFNQHVEHLENRKKDRPMDRPIIKHDRKRYVYIDYSFRVNNEEVTYFFIVDISRPHNMSENTGKILIFIVFIILLIVMIPLLVITTSDIIRPIKKLETGVGYIKDGNLDFKLETKKKNEIGKVIKYFDVMRDELKKSIEKQVKYEENRKELISSISHDLKTPITSIKGYVEGIRDGVANTPEKLEKYLNVIYQKSEDMDKLIDDLFLFSKLDLNRVPYDMKQTPILQLLKDVVNQVKLEWENETRKINFSINFEDAEKLNLTIDQKEIKRALDNVIHNSMKYMDKEKSEINITINENDEYLQIVIADNGMGIHDENVNQIFDKFYRVDESRNSTTGGTGLGLAITKQIIEQHGGKIFVSSEPEKGTKIVMELPIKEIKLEKEGI